MALENNAVFFLVAHSGMQCETLPFT